MTEEKANSETQFMIQRIYVKDLSFETKNTPEVFQQKWEPELSLDVSTKHEKLEDNTYEVVLSVTATVKNQQKVAFLVEIHQGGIFSVQGAPEEQLEHILGSFCPSILYPYAREAITSEVVRGSFPQLVLAPINFDALFMQQQEEKAKATKQQSDEVSH